MNKFIGAALSAVIAAGAILPATTTTADARKGRNAALAAGVILGIAGAAALSSRARADDSNYQWRQRCRRLESKCEDYGKRWACRRYDEECLGDY